MPLFYKFYKKPGLAGWTLVELLMVLSLILLLSSVLVLNFYNRLQSAWAIHEAQNTIFLLVNAARTWRQRQTSYQDISLDTLCKEKLLFNDICLPKFLNPWGGFYKIWSDNNKNFFISLDSVEHPNALKNVLLKSSYQQKSVFIVDHLIKIIFD